MGSSVSCTATTVCPCGFADPCNIMASSTTTTPVMSIGTGNYQSFTLTCTASYFPVLLPGMKLFTLDGSTFTMAIRPTKSDLPATPNADVFNSGTTSCFSSTQLLYQTSGTVAAVQYLVVVPTLNDPQTLYGAIANFFCAPVGSTPCLSDDDCGSTTSYPMYCKKNNLCAPCSSCLQQDNWIGSTSSRACPTQCGEIYWQSDPFSPCPVSCGGGTQSRSVTCFGKMPISSLNFFSGIISDAMCRQSSGGKPATSQSCNTQSCYSWSWTPWSTCSSTCGGGTQTRTITCVGNTGANAASSMCSGQSMAGLGSSVQSCNTNPPCYNWFPQPFGSCTVNCGGGTKSRIVLCGSTTAANPSTKISDFPDFQCDASSKPDHTSACNTDPCPTPEASSSSATTAAAAGGAVGGLVLLAAVAAAVVLLLRRRHKPQPTPDVQAGPQHDDAEKGRQPGSSFVSNPLAMEAECTPYTPGVQESAMPGEAWATGSRNPGMRSMSHILRLDASSPS